MEIKFNQIEYLLIFQLNQNLSFHLNKFTKWIKINRLKIILLTYLSESFLSYSQANKKAKNNYI